MKATAKLKSVPMSVRKMRLVVDLIRGKEIEDALDILRFTNKEAALWLEKALISAVANWEHKLDNEESADDYDLVISEIFADQGAQMKRFRPAPHGRAHRIRKHSCHVTLVVENRYALPSEENEEAEVAEA